MYNTFKISSPLKTPVTLLRLGVMLLLGLIPLISYSADLSVAADNTSALQVEAQQSEKQSETADDFCVVEAFSYVVDWVGKAIKRIEKEHFSTKSNEATEETVAVPAPVVIIEEEAKVVLDLTIPDVNYEGTMRIDKGQKLNFPDLFSAQAKKPFSKEAPSSSFGGRLLMDDEQLENMQEYRLNDVREAVLGAEVSLEFKTN